MITQSVTNHGMHYIAKLEATWQSGEWLLRCFYDPHEAIPRDLFRPFWTRPIEAKTLTWTKTFAPGDPMINEIWTYFQMTGEPFFFQRGELTTAQIAEVL